MKKLKSKVLNSFLLLLVGLAILPTINVKAANYNDMIIERSQWTNDYITKQKGNIHKYQRISVMTRKSDGQFVYCIEPGVSVDPNAVYTGQDYNQSVSAKMTMEQWERVELLAYFGYGYDNHTDLKWYTVTQYLIWQTAPNGYDIYFTDKLNGNKITKYTNEINELNRLVNEHYKVPSFVTDDYEMNIGDTLSLTDTNNVLSNWNVSSDADCNVEVSGNQVTITSDKEQDITLNMSRKGLSSNTSIIYRSQGYQTVGVLKLNTPIIRSTSVKLVNVEYPTITKEVSKDKVELGEEFTYTFQYTVDKLEEGIYYNSFLIEDTFEPVLKLTDVNQVKIYKE